jgi:hypothetical protein
MLDLTHLVRQIQRNCDISDAQHGGVFSVCGLALRLRDLYKWEQGMGPWAEEDPAALLEWIGKREQYWESVAGLEYNRLALSDPKVDPFDEEAVNSVLAPHGLYYGAGYARGLKPTFFLALIEDRWEIDGCSVYGLGRELARDLLTLPALSQGRTILLRRESARRFLWDQISFVAPSGRRALDAALDACGLADHRPAALRERLGELLAVQEGLHLHHELGEILDPHFGRDHWREIIAAFPLTRVEILARHVKDLLADTHSSGTLRHVCGRRSTAGLALYLAFADRLTKALFPRLGPCFDEFLQTRDWAAVERAVEAGHSEARRHADVLLSAYIEGKEHNDLGRVERAVEAGFRPFLDGRP